MKYLGGKSRTYKQICAFLESIRKPNQPFVEPFCGACWVTQGMSGARYAADANKALITMWKALQEGWEPDSAVTQGMYDNYRLAQNLNDPMTAFIGIGVSFSGKWFGGMARSNTRNYASNAKNSLLKKLPKLSTVKFAHKVYQDVNVTNCLIYCDPPYADTTTYAGVDKFDSEQFWDIMREWSKHNVVVISEYASPDDFVCVLEISTKTDMHTKSGKEARIEKLFMHKSQIHLCNSQS